MSKAFALQVGIIPNGYTEYTEKPRLMMYE